MLKRIQLGQFTACVSPGTACPTARPVGPGTRPAGRSRRGRRPPDRWSAGGRASARGRGSARAAATGCIRRCLADSRACGPDALHEIERRIHSRARIGDVPNRPRNRHAAAAQGGDDPKLTGHVVRRALDVAEGRPAQHERFGHTADGVGEIAAPGPRSGWHSAARRQAVPVGWRAATPAGRRRRDPGGGRSPVARIHSRGSVAVGPVFVGYIIPTSRMCGRPTSRPRVR